MHNDHRPYYDLTKWSRLDKEVNSLIGIVDGIAIDRRINAAELDFFRQWIAENYDLRNRHPLNELMPVVAQAIEDGILTDEEKEDIAWLCRKLRSTQFFDETTADLQRLHAVVAGIAADGTITEKELDGLAEWLADNDHLRTCWPYDELDALITSVMSDRKIDSTEQQVLLGFFSEFHTSMERKTIVGRTELGSCSLRGVCAVCPEIRFEQSTFCFTGASSQYSRAELVETVTRLGGVPIKSVTQSLDYLIIGAEGNPCWAYACYGRKVEQAVDLRKRGFRLLLVHEHDFHDAVADSGVAK